MGHQEMLADALMCCSLALVAWVLGDRTGYRRAIQGLLREDEEGRTDG